jgi:hypothetical protein
MYSADILSTQRTKATVYNKHCANVPSPMQQALGMAAEQSNCCGVTIRANLHLWTLTRTMAPVLLKAMRGTLSVTTAMLLVVVAQPGAVMVVMASCC